MLEIAIPHVKVNRIARRGFSAPQLPGRKTDRIQVLRMLALKLRVGIREHENAAIANDSAFLTARVSGQAGMAQRIHVPCANPLSDLETSFRLRLRPHKVAASQRA